MGPKITLTELLDARERRAARQKTLLVAYPGHTLISLTVNTPGPVKRPPEADRLFEAGRRELLAALSNAGLVPVHRETVRPSTGCELRLLVPAEPMALKRLTCELETRLPYGRLLDADVLDAAGRPLSRGALNLPERGCIVCGREGAYCASRRLHPLEEIFAAFTRIAGTLSEETPCGRS